MKKPVTFNDGYDVGVVMYHSWGWEQTNIDFYEVVKRTKATVWFKPLSKINTYNPQNSMIGKCVPDMSSFIAPTEHTMFGAWDGETPFKKRLSVNKDTGGVRGVSPESGWMRNWDGTEKSWTAYA